MQSNFKLQSRHSSSSSGSLKFINFSDLDNIAADRQSRKDLFDMLLEDGPLTLQSIPALNLSRIQQNAEVMKTIEQLNLSPRSLSQQQGCKCTKIDCLKLYCECFAKGKTCNSSCICITCKNNEENIEQIYHAKQLVNLRHPNYFYGIPAIVPGRRCTCKKSQCRKKYCECYNAGLKCTDDCDCCDCHNGKPDMDHYYERSRMEIEVHA